MVSKTEYSRDGVNSQHYQAASLNHQTPVHHSTTASQRPRRPAADAPSCTPPAVTLLTASERCPVQTAPDLSAHDNNSKYCTVAAMRATDYSQVLHVSGAQITEVTTSTQCYLYVVEIL